MTSDSSVTAPDRRDDRRALLTVSGALLLVFGLGAAAQTVFVFRAAEHGAPGFGDTAIDLGGRLLANGVAVVAALALTVAFRLHERRAWARLGFVLLIAVSIAFLRYGLQLVLHVYPRPTWEVFGAEIVSVSLVTLVALSLGLAQADARARLREQERAGARQTLRAAAALDQLNREELRVRREIAEGLHGTVQNRLVLAGVQLDAVIDRWRAHAPDADAMAALRTVREDLDDIRERDVREMSQLLYPAGIGLGVAHAVRLLVQRIPATIATEVVIDPVLATGDVLDVDRRVLLVRATEEAITNALKHGGAGSMRIELAQDAGGGIRLTVADDGTGLGSETPWSGLSRLAARMQAVGGTVSLGGMPPHGALLTVTLPGGGDHAPAD